MRRDENTCAMAIMAKAPSAGAVKTRLVPPLTSQEAAALSRSFLRDAATKIAKISSRMNAPPCLVFAPADQKSTFRKLVPRRFKLVAQRGEPLGERVLHAAQDLFTAGYASVCLLNADSPTLPSAFLAQAVEELNRPGDRVVLGPAEDGGYYLVGMKRLHAQLFESIPWSTNEVFCETLERAGKIGLEVASLPKWHDVDDVASLSRLCSELFVAAGLARRRKGGNLSASHTRRYLAAFLKNGGAERLGWRPRGPEELHA